MRQVLFIFIAILFSFVCIAQDHNEKLDALFNALAEKQEFNGNLVVAKGNEVLYEKSLGYADMEQKTPLTSSSVFELASMGKQFTAMGFLLLREQGKLHYDDKVVEHLKGFPYPTVTIRHLLNMTSGIPDYIDFPDSFANAGILNNHKLLEFYKTNQPTLKFYPNAEFDYSNINYVFLAKIIELVSEMPFADYLKQSVFDKLEMTHTRSYSKRFTESEKISNYAYPYVKVGGKLVRTDENEATRYIIAASGIEGDGSIVSTTGDLIRWTNALKNNTLVKPETLKEAYSPAILSNGKKSDYGFGMYVEKNKAWHWGGWPGIQTSYTRLLDKDLTIIYLKNVESNNWSWIPEFEKLAVKKVKELGK